MASINTDEMNLNNLSQLEGINISVPGTYEVKYKYVDSRGRIFICQEKVDGIIKY